MTKNILIQQAKDFKKKIKALENDPNFKNICNKIKLENQILKNKNIWNLKACLVSQTSKYDIEAFVNVVFLSEKEINKKLNFAFEKPNYQIYSMIKLIEIL